MNSEESGTRVGKSKLKRLSRMYESGISIMDVAEQIKMDEVAVRKLLRQLGYAVEITKA